MPALDSSVAANSAGEAEFRSAIGYVETAGHIESAIRHWETTFYTSVILAVGRKAFAVGVAARLTIGV